jgi:hypothetical protein
MLRPPATFCQAFGLEKRNQREASEHPEGMPDVCDPCGVDWAFFGGPGVSLRLDPRLHFEKPSVCSFRSERQRLAGEFRGAENPNAASRYGSRVLTFENFM